MDFGRSAAKGLAVACLLGLAAPVGQPGADERTAYEYSLVAFDGKEVSLSTFKGKVLLIVNLASQSIFKDQIPLLEELQKSYKDKGLVVLGVPCNDFGGQEPGPDAEIQKIYTTDLHLSFRVFARASVRGKNQAALYKFLTSDKTVPTARDVHWSYTKFVVDRRGKAVARFEPDVPPNSPELVTIIEQVLAGTFKPAQSKGEQEDKKAGGEQRRDPGR